MWEGILQLPMVWVKISAWQDSMGQQQLLVQKHLVFFPTQIYFQLIQQPVYLGLTYFTGPVYLHMGTGLMTHLAFASPLPLFLCPTNLKFSVQDWTEESREFQNCRVYRDDNMAVKSLSDKYNIIILTLYIISEVWGKWQY